MLAVVCTLKGAAGADTGAFDSTPNQEEVLRYITYLLLNRRRYITLTYDQDGQCKG